MQARHMDPIVLATACYHCMLENSMPEDIGLAAMGICDVAPDNAKLASLVVTSSDQRGNIWLDAIKMCMLSCIHERLCTIFHNAQQEGRNLSRIHMQGDYYNSILCFVQEMFSKAV
jgi:hypothetical protein